MKFIEKLPYEIYGLAFFSLFLINLIIAIGLFIYGNMELALRFFILTVIISFVLSKIGERVDKEEEISKICEEIDFDMK